MKKISVLLVDDHAIVREGLRALLQMEEDLEIVGEAEDGRQAVLLAKKRPPEVVVMDVAMPMLNGMEATRQILRAFPATAVLVLSSYAEDECVDQLVEAGAAGYLMKQAAASELPRAIREVRRGNQFFSPAIAKRMRERESAAFNQGQPLKKSCALTEREIEVLQLVTQGLSNQEAADELGISIKTIEKHRQQVMNKLNIHEVAGLTRWALARGLVEGSKPAAFEAAVA